MNVVWKHLKVNLIEVQNGEGHDGGSLPQVVHEAIRNRGGKIKEDYGRDVLLTVELNGFTPRPMNFDELVAWYVFLDSRRHDIPSDLEVIEKVIDLANEYLDEIIFTEDIEKEIKERLESGDNADIASLMLLIYKRVESTQGACKWQFPRSSRRGYRGS